MAHSHGWQVSAGYQWEGSVPLRVGLFTGLSVLMTGWLASPRASDAMVQGGSDCIIFDLGLEITHHTL